MISRKIEKAFCEQLNAELYSAYLYLSMAAYFDSDNLPGLSNWMKVQAQEEVAHAMKFYEHIDERGGAVTLKAIAGPKTSWKSPMEAFQDAYKHEQKVTGLIDKLMTLAEAEKDRAARIFLEWFVTEQVEEEASVDYVVQRLKKSKDAPMALLMLDKELAARKSNISTTEGGE
jgi:ferritin